MLYCLFRFSLHANAGKSYSEFRNGGRKSDFWLCCRNKSFGIGAARNVACVTQWESQLKAISTLASGQDLLAVLKLYPTFTSCQNAACSNTFFFLWRVDYALEGSMFWLSKCDFSRLFNTERLWHAYWFPVVFEFLIGMICPLMQKHFLWPLSKRKALSCGSTRLLGPLFLSKVSQDLNS